MKLTCIYILSFILTGFSLVAQKITIRSPNQKINAGLFCQQNTDTGEWYLKVSYSDSGKTTEAIPRIDLGLSRSDQNFAKELKFLKAGKQTLVSEKYTALHGKKALCTNSANEVI